MVQKHILTHLYDYIVTDIILNKSATQVNAEEAMNTYGAKVFAVARRVLRKKERKNYPIPIEFIR